MSIVLHCEDHSRIVVGAIYRPGSASEYDITLLNYLDNAIDRVRGLGSHLLLAGDFNVHNADWLGSTKTTHAGEVMEEIGAGHHLTQHVNTPTRGQNALDLVISDLPGTVSGSTLPPLGRSDHCVVTADFKTANPYANLPPRDKCGDMLMLIGTGCEPTFAVLTGQPSPAPVQSNAV